MMKVFVIVLLFMLFSNFSLLATGRTILQCRNNTESVLDDQEKETKEKIEDKQDELNDAIDDYKEALEKKKEMMQKLWTTTAHIEFLMKENQIVRKEMIKHWRDVKDTQASGQSL